MSQQQNTTTNVTESLTLTVKDISLMMGISLAKTYELTHRQDFLGIHVGRRMVIPRSSFLKWLETAAQSNVL